MDLARRHDQRPILNITPTPQAAEGERGFFLLVDEDGEWDGARVVALVGARGRGGVVGIPAAPTAVSGLGRTIGGGLRCRCGRLDVDQFIFEFWPSANDLLFNSLKRATCKAGEVTQINAGLNSKVPLREARVDI
jgi:hypothetical protein